MTRIMVLLAVLVIQTLGAATVTFNGGVTNQVIDGFGVNANHRSWNNDELKPVIDALVDQAGMTLFRVVYDDANWEATNDNSDPDVMNWGYYAPLYSNAEFSKLWNLVGYLNSKGITTNGVIFNFMGPGPAWMGGDSLTPGMESEWAEMITSLLVWARYTNGLQFRYVGPDNEPDHSNEGITISSASQYVTALRALAQKLDANNLSDVRLVAPDLAGGGTTYMPQMLADTVAMGKLGHFGVHSYSDGGSGSSGVYAYLQASAYPDRTFWMTEFNVWCSTCDSGTRGTYDWSYCKGTAEYLMQHLLNNASGGIVWEGYDSYYLHPPTAWSFWGLLSVDDENAAVKTYTPRKNFYTVAQISKWVRPGAQRIGVSGSTGSFSPLLAFKHAGLGQITIVGINTSGSTATLSGALASLPTVPRLDLYYTSATTNLANGGSVAVNNGTFSATIPADCVFTLTGFTGVNVVLTNPVNGAQFNAPAAIPLAATATTTAGSIALVGFCNGVTELGEATIAPYQFTWNNVPMGNYALTAVAGDTLGNVGTSAVVNVAVVGPLAQIGVSPANATVAPGGQQQFSATGADALGHALVPQPAFSWSVSGGGTITGSGLFTAGGSAGGPFNVAASNGGITGAAAVSVSAISGGGTIGNTNEGTLTDTMWDGGAWINACRFQAASNMTVTTMFAKVGAISGKYKCAIYTDSSAQPKQLLGSAAEVSNPASGWQSFALTTSVVLTNGSYYWLAIWSDNSSGRVYYSNTAGTLRWGQYNYGAWPNPISTTGGGSLNYCIYGTGTGATLTNITVVPANPNILAGATQPFTATGAYSDGSTQNVTSQATWTSSDTAVATVNANGLATAVAVGTSTVAAALGGTTGSSTLTVQVAPVVITTASLSSGTVSVTYSATLTASGGTPPNSWSTISGSLPAGLTLNPNDGVIIGAPTTAGTFNFTVQVSDASLPMQTATKLLSITVAPTLTSVTVTPANPTILSGASQQFTATGTYSDGSTQSFTSQATWTSSRTAVATINASGLAVAITPGAATISAAAGGVAGSTTLTVQALPLAITTTLLATGVVNAAYTVGIVANGGVTPYAWSITGGSLPAGLTLNSASGTITGTPTVGGLFNFTAQMTDASQPAQSASQALSIMISSVPAIVTIWPSTAVPGRVDGGATRAAELGVKFRSDVAGTVTGIRFYKASANTGSHVGSLWTGGGSQMATGTFVNESASGWQQVTLATPVVISANTTYVASYHVNNGHFSADASTFSAAGVDNPPLHALPNSVTGGNGVYRNSSSSAFPNTSGKGTNYWIDVVFKPTVPRTLASIAVTPANPTIMGGGTQQFTATGAYSDGSMQDVTSQATWSSSKTAISTTSASGLATAVSAGTATISAALSGVTGSTTLTVQAVPLAITTASLTTGMVSVAYSATLAASGGTLAYTWSVTSGALPAGLTLNASSGAIAGTPTTAGTLSFTAEVTDAGSPSQTAAKALSLMIAPMPTAVSIWPSAAVPGVVDGGPDSAVELGVKFRSDVNGKVTGIRFYKAAANTGSHVGNLWSSAGTKLATATFSGETTSGWQLVSFTTPVAITSNTVYVASYHANSGHYSADINYFSGKGADNPPLHALANGVSGGNGVYAYGTSSAFPNSTWNAANYWVDVVFAVSNP